MSEDPDSAPMSAESPSTESTVPDSSSPESTPTEPIAITGATDLDALCESHHTVLVAFTAEWCGPCQGMKPALNALARETETVVVTADVDECESLASDHAIRQLPTQLVFVDGELAEQLVGSQTETRLRRTITSVRN